MKKHSGKHVDARKRAGVRRTLPSSPVAGTTNNAIFLVGFMGAGKTSVGRVLGENLAWTFEDLDDRIEQRERRTVAEIFRDSGEPEFRRAEQSALQEILEELRGGAKRVVALGGGAFVQQENADLLLAAGVPTVFLEAPVEHLWRRCSRQSAESGVERPLLKSREHFRKLYEARQPNYSKARLKIQTESRAVEEIAAEIADCLGLKPREKRPLKKKIATRIEEGEAE